MKWVIDKIFKNFFYKLTALFLSVGLWYFVQSEEVLEITRRIEATIETPPGILIKEPRVHLRDITLRGPRVLLRNYSDQPIPVIIKIPAGRVGALRFRIDRDFLPVLDQRIRVVFHDPYIAVYADEKLSKSVRVRPSLSGEVARGFSLMSALVEPHEVQISGLKSELQKISEILTEPVDIQGLEESKTIVAVLSHLTHYEFDSTTEKVKVVVTVEATGRR